MQTPLTIKVSAIGLGLALSITAHAQGGVRTLSSDELVDTFIEDSAIVVSPRARQQPTMEETRQRAIRAIIRPGEPIVTEAETEADILSEYSRRMDSLSDAQELAREDFIRRSLVAPGEQLASAQPVIDTALPAPPVFGISRPAIPEAPFQKTYFNDQLGLAFDGETLDFNIGSNLPGVDQINVPHAIDEGPIQLEPRPGGGFDLSIAVPD